MERVNHVYFPEVDEDRFITTSQDVIVFELVILVQIADIALNHLETIRLPSDQKTFGLEGLCYHFSPVLQFVEFTMIEVFIMVNFLHKPDDILEMK